MKQQLTGLLIISLISLSAISAHAQINDLDDLDGAPQQLQRWRLTEVRGCTTIREGGVVTRVCRAERRGTAPSWITPRTRLQDEIPGRLGVSDLPGDDEVGTPARPRRDGPPAILLPRRDGRPAIIPPRRDGRPAIVLPRRARRLTPRLGQIPAPWAPPRATRPTPAPASRAPLPPTQRPRATAPRPRTVAVALTPREAQVFALLNAERRRRGLRTLRVDPRAVLVARAHSQDMCARHYFDHRSPSGLAPWDRLRAGGVRFSAAGENIAVGYTTALGVHSGWMESPGHRANRLNPTYTRVGIGVFTCGDQPRWTEVFMK